MRAFGRVATMTTDDDVATRRWVTPLNLCRDCGHKIETASALDNNSAEPREGDVSLCLYCGCASIFSGHGIELRDPTADESADIEGSPAIARIRRAMAQARR